MQKGSIRISGKWWYCKVRENVIENGQSVRKPMYHKLAPVAQYRPSSNGEPPPPFALWQTRSVRRSMLASARDCLQTRSNLPIGFRERLV
jgi:hypothetical protein